jgi:hypothetical protein
MLMKGQRRMQKSMMVHAHCLSGRFVLVRMAPINFKCQSELRYRLRKPILPASLETTGVISVEYR